MTTQLDLPPEELAEAFNSLDIPQDVAELLEVPYKKLVYYLWHIDESEKYRSFYVHKSRGGVRKIQVPTRALKLIQRRLNQVLQAVYEPRLCTHGFVPGRSIVTNAVQHCGKEWVLSVDIADFFPSINFGRVYGLLQAHPYNRNHKVAAVIAQACCHKNELPQGAPTSPVVANMIAARMDSELEQLARSVRCVYTRYADDLTFSTSEEEFPEELAACSEGPSADCSVGSALRRIIESNGFMINRDKTRLCGQHHRQVVTGLKVNDKPNVHQGDLSQIRAMLHAWEVYGVEAAEQEFYQKYDAKHRHPKYGKPAFRDVVWGKIQFVKMVRGADNNSVQRYIRQYRELAGETVEDAIWVVETLDDAGGIGSATGFMLRGVGLVTADHVVCGGTEVFQPDSPDERFQVTVLARDADLDLAILEIDVEASHSLEVGKPRDIERGSHVMALGFPGGWGHASSQVSHYPAQVTRRLRRMSQDFFELSAGIYPGVSGGPVLDRNGRVVAVAQRGDEEQRARPFNSPGAMSIEALRHLVQEDVAIRIGLSG